MAVRGGDPTSVSILGRNFPVSSGSDTQRKLGGTSNDVKMNGDGSFRTVSTRQSASVSLTLAIDSDRDDQQFLQGAADRAEQGPCVVSYADGTDWNIADAVVTGELTFNSQDATMSVTLTGSKMAKQ